MTVDQSVVILTLILILGTYIPMKSNSHFSKYPINKRFLKNKIWHADCFITARAHEQVMLNGF